MVRVIFTFAIAVAFALPSLGQNILPNPGFESFSTCPSSIGNMPGYVNNWDRANTASPDYGNCGFSGNSAIRFTPRTGSGVIGMWGGASHPSCATSAYSEAIRATLTSPMTTGQSYTVSVAVRVDGVGTSTSTPNNCVDFGMYFYNSASPPPTPGWCCLPVSPQWSVSGNLIQDGVYTVFTGTVTATGNFNRVIIGPFCNGNTTGAACSNYGTARMYFNLDDVSAQQSVVLDAGSLVLQGEAFGEFNALSWELGEGAAFERFMLERSGDGQGFQVIAEADAEAGRVLFSERDARPLEGENYYRVAAVGLDGQVAHSNVLRLLQGRVEGEGELSYFYDQAAEEIRFSLDAENGGAYEMLVLDAAGRMVGRESFQKGPGQQDFALGFSGYAEGLYVLQLNALSQNKVWRNKFLHHR